MKITFASDIDDICQKLSRFYNVTYSSIMQYLN